MKVTLGDLADSFTALGKLANQPFPAKLSYKLGRVWRDAQREYGDLQERMVGLIRQYGGVELRPGYWSIPPVEAGASEAERQRKTEEMANYQRESGELSEVEIDLWAGSQPIHLDELGDAAITPSDLALLHWLVQAPEAETVTEMPTAKAAAAAGD